MTVDANKYYGQVAKNYDAARNKSTRWQLEQRAVADYVTTGPVLDVPFGTGRYVPIYRAKGLVFRGIDISSDMLDVAKSKYGNDIQVSLGSVFKLPFLSKTFGTVVCTRLLDWLPPQDMLRAITELRRVAHTIIVTIRYGTEGISINYTHSLEKFYEAISGLWIESRRVTEVGKHGTEEIFKLRQPTFEDALAQLSWGNKDPLSLLQRLAYEGLGRLTYPNVHVTKAGLHVSAEYWTGEELGRVLDGMAVHDNDAPKLSRYITNLPVRHKGEAIVVFEHEGHRVLIDGRRRCNVIRHIHGPHLVLVLRS